MQDTQTKEEMIRLFVPNSGQEMLFKAAQYNPKEGHLGQDKILNWLMAHFY